MQYFGGKARLAKDIAGHVLELRGDRQNYLEPFVGGAAMFVTLAPFFDRAVAGDLHEDLVLLWQAIRDGWQPPTHVSRDEYDRLRNAEPSALRGFVGYAHSYGGKWFGGYYTKRVRWDGARRRMATTRGPSSARRTAMGHARRFQGAVIELADYRRWDGMVDASWVVYADPPYAGCAQYTAIERFDSAEFWRVAASWAERGALVLVSEYTAPPGWRSVWSKEVETRVSGHSNQTTRATEHLFIHEDDG